MEEKKKTLSEMVLNRLNIIIQNQKLIKADTTAIGQTLMQYYKGQKAPINSNVPFIIPNMTEAQAKALMRQGMYPEIVAMYSDNKYTVAHLYKLFNGGK